VPGLQRAVAVRASDTGSLAALREPFRPPHVSPVGNNLAEDIARMRPYFSFTRSRDEGRRIEPKLEIAIPVAEISRGVVVSEEEDEGDGGFEAEALPRDAHDISRLWDIIAQYQTVRQRPGPLGHGLFAEDKPVHGADLMLRVQGSIEFPAHTIVLSARCSVLAHIIAGLGSVHDRESGISLEFLPGPNPRSSPGPPPVLAEAPRLAVAGVHTFSVLILLHYLYTDVLLAVNDPRLMHLTAEAFAHGHLQPGQVVRELQALTRVLHLDILSDVLRGAVRREPSPSLNTHFQGIFDSPLSLSPPDVVLCLADREVWSHSFVLRARSPFFESFFSDEAWTEDRWEKDGTLRVDLRHLVWRSMQYVLRFMCCGEEAEMFERLGMCDPLLDLLMS
jgi:inhibitor of Bruton tyrosine kinase